MSLRRLLALLLVIGLVAVACGQDGPEPTPDEQTPGPAAAPVRGGTLVVALTGEPAHLNPAITTAGEIHAASEILYNGLLALNAEGEPEPDLATALPEIEEDGAVYRFTLPEDVQWHDGQPLTSEDVKFTFEEILLQFHARTSASVEPALESIETPDERTVVFRFNGPYAPFLQQLDVTEAPILPKHIYEGSDPNTNPANVAPVGSGPFKFESFTQGSEITYTRNDNYFKDDLPYLDRIVMRIITDETARVAALERGEVDWIPGVPGPSLEGLQASGDIETAETSWNPGGANCIMTISLNLDLPMFGDPDVRRAIAHGLDKEQFVNQVLFGQGRAATAPISSGIPWAHGTDVDLPQYDPQLAEQLLEDAGWLEQADGPRVAEGVAEVADGTELSFDFLHFPQFSKYGELVRQQLGDIGIDVTQRPLDPAAFRETVFAQDDFDSNIISYCNSTDPEIGVRRMYHSSQIGDVPFTNSSHYSNPRVDSLFDQAGKEIALDERGSLYREIQQVLAEDLPYIWVVETLAVRAYAARCDGFVFHNGLFAEAAYCEAESGS